MAARQQRGLRLLARDEDDLGVISAALQDAVAQVKALNFQPGARRFTAEFNRFRWEEAMRSSRDERVRSALQIEGVIQARARGVSREHDDAVVSLLAISFAAGEEAPGGVVSLLFAGGGAIALEVECIEVLLMDISKAWRASGRPDHPAAADDA